MPALDASILTVNYITKNYSGPYTLYLSGGVDSQAMLYAWHISGVPFDTFSAVYHDSLNSHDIVTLQQFCQDHSINVNYHDFDVEKFLQQEHEYYANRYRCGSPQITTFMKLADLTQSGTVIMSGNFILDKYTGIPDRNNFSLYHYGIASGKSIVPWFFLETCEIAYAFQKSKSIRNSNKSQDSYQRKVATYQVHGFPVIPQETKFNGFEKIKEKYDTNPPRVPTLHEKLSRLPGQTSNRNFDLLYRNKYEAKFFNYKYVVQC